MDLRAFVRSYWWGVPTTRHLQLAPSPASAGDGKGTRVVLLDTGMLLNHPVFEGANVILRDFTACELSSDPDWHATRNAAALVGQSPIRGLIPESELFVGRVLAQGLLGHPPDKCIVDGLAWARQVRAHFVVLPLGRSKGSALIVRAIQLALADGIQIFAAAGNRGAFNHLFPAYLEGVVSVTGAAPDGSILDLCCASDRVDVLGPGLHVPVVAARGTTTSSGSSIACVLAAGAAVLSQPQTSAL